MISDGINCDLADVVDYQTCFNGWSCIILFPQMNFFEIVLLAHDH